MRLRVGTSGFSYTEWRGHFYPEDLKSGEMLRYYASQLDSVEINNTFYRLPRADVVAGWADQVPEGFRFVLKASRRITHQQRLKDCADSVSYLFKVAAILGDKLGPVLFQLPPNFRRDVARLREFLAVLPDSCQPAFEFRHESWFADDVYAVLEDRGAALCCADVDDESQCAPFKRTAEFGYLRLRRTEYSADELLGWARRIHEQPWRETYVFFKHETAGPDLAQQLVDRFHAVRMSSAPPASGPGLARVEPRPHPALRERAR
jgi:uncharacterized protein YecE (DUF72 family)